MTATDQTCKHCKVTLLGAELNGKEALYCPSCCQFDTHKDVPDTRPRTGILPGLQPGSQEVLIREKEEPIMQRVMHFLRLAGYQVEPLARRRKMQHCQTCHSWFHQQGSDGVSKYVGDFLVAVPKQNPTSWIMLDAKSTTGRGTREQKETAAKGLLFFVRSETEALSIVEQFEPVKADE